MNTAELDLLRRSLGLSVPETASVLGTSVRTTSYWLGGDGEPRRPDEISARLREVEVAMGDVAEDLSAQAEEQERAEVLLVRYRTQEQLDASGVGRGLPLGAHAMALAWAMDELRADGHQVVVRWSDEA